ncbi:NAD(P)H-dependent oxidoreductase [Metamycoplasma hyosynoviae]|uniref:NAD(P)H-dependent oxidoreductase n=1 Tax=Metamycoplasma hyosynoviae TaxID=29559 RepID=UPI0023595918|nr:NAD(P)H-dependent oxidoreductase [Metamycoplasma hyosynoviae]MDC8914142.1 NAD(P)H-dependent oxidoreductase [Metamycoplasma hyosynoviae]
MKKIYIIMSHPTVDSFNGKLAEAYRKKLETLNYEVRQTNLIDLKFDLNLRKTSKLEPDLIKAQEDIKWADEIIFFYPLWWGNFPALLKGFIDRVFIPGFSHKYHKNNPLWDKLLKGKTARIFRTCDAPNWFISLLYKNSDLNSLKNGVCWFTGIKVKQVVKIDKLVYRNQTNREKLINKIINKIK